MSDPSDDGAPHDVRRPRRGGDAGTRRRRIGIMLFLAGLLIVLAGVWLVVTGLLARRELTTVRAEVRSLRAQISAGQLDAAEATAGDLAKHADRAHGLTTGPVWATAAALPWAGTTFESARGIAASADSLAGSVL